MEQTVKVRNLCEDGTAEVIHIRQSACSGDCHKCAGCGAATETMVVRAENSIGARPGDLVVISSESAKVLKAAAVFYMIPLVLFFAGYALGDGLQIGGGWVGCLSFVLGILAAVFMDRRWGKKDNTVYTIIGFAPKKG